MILEEKEALLEAVKTGFIDCQYLHHNSCLISALQRFVKIFKFSYSYYIPIYIIPLLIYKKKQLKKDPQKTTIMAIKHYFNSLCFMSSFVALMKYLICLTKNYRHKTDHLNIAISAFFASFTILLETPNRQIEIALFILPRFFQTFWNYLKSKKLLTRIPQGDALLFGFSMAIINYFYKNEQDCIKLHVLSFLKNFIQDN